MLAPPKYSPITPTAASVTRRLGMLVLVQDQRVRLKKTTANGGRLMFNE